MRKLVIVAALFVTASLSAQTSIGQMHQRYASAADVSLTGRTASLATTNIIGTASAGIYNVCWSQQITRAATTSSSLLTTIGWNNGAAKTTASMALNGGLLQLTADVTNVLNSSGGNCILIFSVDAQPITVSTTYLSVGGTTMQYSLFVTAERLQ